MNHRFILRARAQHDLNRQLDYFDRSGSSTAGDRFLSAFLATCRDLVSHPSMGKVVRPAKGRRFSVRQLPVTTPFESYLIFYSQSVIGIDVIRLLHGARDIDRLIQR